MPTALPQQLALDLTGLSAANKINGEIHTLDAKQVRVVAPIYGGFYTESVRVVDASTQAVLVKDVSYKCVDLLSVPTGKSGKEICSIIIILDRAVSSNIRIDYQAVGGWYARTYETIKGLLNALTLDNRPILWPNVLNKPLSFSPTQHFVNLGEVVGFDYVAEVLESIRTAILLGDDVDHDQILTYVDTQIPAIIAALNARVTTEITPAITAANTAKVQSDVALSRVTPLQTSNALAVTNSNSALVIAQAVQADEQTTAARALALIQTSIGERSFVKIRPIVSTVSPKTLTDSYPHPLIDYDYYSLDVLGNVKHRGIPSTSPYPDILNILIQTLRDEGDKTIRVVLKITLNDLRSPFYYQEITDPAQYFVANNTVSDGVGTRRVYVSGGDGYYSPSCDVIIYPPKLSNDISSAMDIANDNKAGLVPVFVNYSNITTSVNGLSTQNYPVSGVTPINLNPLYGIIGVDDQNNLLNAVTPGDNTALNRIVGSLFDFRSDFNMAGYGSVDKRRPVRFRLKSGTSITLHVQLTASDLETLLKSVMVSFRKSITIGYVNNWSVQASAGSITGVTPNSTVTCANPDDSRIRSISADIDTVISSPSNANSSLATAPAGPTTFIAAQFEASLITIDTGGRGRRSLKIVNRSEGNVIIDQVQYSDGHGTDTTVARHLNRNPGDFYEYNNLNYNYISFPLTPLGSGQDVTEYIRWYLSNGQLVTFGVTAASSTVIVTTTVGTPTAEFIPVFSGLSINPATGVVGSTSNLIASFTGLIPSINNTIYINSLTGGFSGNITVTADSAGNGTYTWEVTVGTTDRFLSVTALNVTKGVTLTRSFTPSFSALSINPTSGAEGTAAVLTAQFSNLQPSAATTISLTEFLGGSAGNIVVNADSSGNASYTWNYTVGSADLTITITAYGSQRTVVLSKNYQPAFSSIAFAQASAYDNQAITLRLNFINMRPSSTNTISTTTTFSSNPAVTQNNSIIANSNGVGYVDFSYVMGAADISVSVTSLSTTRAASISNAGPTLSTVRFNPTTQYIGQSASFIARFINVPLSGGNISADIVITNLTSNAASFTGTYGAQTVTLVPDGTGVVEKTFTFTMVDGADKTLRLQYKAANLQATISASSVPTFSTLVLSPASGALGSTSNLIATFTGLTPNINNTIYIDSITGGSAGNITVAANSYGVGTYTVSQTVGTTSRDLTITALGLTKTATLVRVFTPTFSALSVSPTNGVQGTAAVLTAQFSNLQPSVSTIVAISEFVGGTTGNITVTADSSGNASYTWNYTVGSADLTITITAYGSQRTVVLTKNYVATLAGAAFIETSQYAGRGTTLRINYTSMRPSTVTSISTVLSDLNNPGSLDGGGSYSISSDASGNGYRDVAYSMVNSSLGLKYSVYLTGSAQANYTAICAYAGPNLISASFSAPSVVIGNTVDMTLTFNNMPLSGAPISLTVYIQNNSGGTTVLTGNYGAQVITLTPNGSSVITKTFTYTLVSAPRPEVIQVNYNGSVTTGQLTQAWNPVLSSVEWLNMPGFYKIVNSGAFYPETDSLYKSCALRFYCTGMQPNEVNTFGITVTTSSSGVVATLGYIPLGGILADANGNGFGTLINFRFTTLGLKNFTVSKDNVSISTSIYSRLPITLTNASVGGYESAAILLAHYGKLVGYANSLNYSYRISNQLLTDAILASYSSDLSNYAIRATVLNYVGDPPTLYPNTFTIIPDYENPNNYLNLNSSSYMLNAWVPLNYSSMVMLMPSEAQTNSANVKIEIKYVPTGEIINDAVINMSAIPPPFNPNGP